MTDKKQSPSKQAADPPVTKELTALNSAVKKAEAEPKPAAPPTAETVKPEAPKAEKPADSGQATEEKKPSPCKDKPGNFALVIDDEPANRDFLVRLLEQAQLQVKGAVDGGDALNQLKDVECARIIAIDHKLPDMDGVELLAQLRPRYPEARLVMATMLDDRALMEKAFANGCDVFLVKPHGFMELFRRVQLLDSKEDGLERLVIDQYGPRPFRG